MEKNKNNVNFKKKITKTIKKTKIKPKFETKLHTLIKNVTIGDVLKKKGQKVALTEKARVFFKSKFYIK